MKNINWKYTDEDGNVHYDCDVVGYIFLITLILFTVGTTIGLYLTFLR